MGKVTPPDGYHHHIMVHLQATFLSHPLPSRPLCARPPSVSSCWCRRTRGSETDTHDGLCPVSPPPLQEQLPNRTLGEVVEYFYRWKMSPEYQVWKAGRLPRQIEEQFVPDFHADNCHVSLSASFVL